METLTPTPVCSHAKFHFKTKHPTEFIDLTVLLDKVVADAELRSGIVNVQSLHTTTSVVVNEHEPLLLADFQALLHSIAPDDGHYRHDDTTARTVNLTDAERPNGHGHCRALLLPTSVCINVASGRMMLGQWQRIFLVELDGPRERQVSVTVLGEGGR